jgi:hypothetical protein
MFKGIGWVPELLWALWRRKESCHAENYEKAVGAGEMDASYTHVSCFPWPRFRISVIMLENFHSVSLSFGTSIPAPLTMRNVKTQLTGKNLISAIYDSVSVAKVI